MDELKDLACQLLADASISDTTANQPGSETERSHFDSQKAADKQSEIIKEVSKPTKTRTQRSQSAHDQSPSIVSPIMEKGFKCAKQAAEADAAGKWKEAITFYTHSLEYFLHSLKYEAISDKAKTTLKDRCTDQLRRADMLKKHLLNQHKGVPQRATASLRKTYESVTEDFLRGVVLTEKPNVHWNDVAGLSAAKQALQELLIFPIKFPRLLKGKQNSVKGILLYGPPGTGKSLLAKAVATEAPYTFFSVLSIDISKKATQSIHFVETLFKEAKTRKPSIIFIDEIEVVCTDSVESNDIRLVRNEVLRQMRVLEDGVILMGATNMPWVLDSEFRRIFQRHIHVSLPDDAQTRMQIIEGSIGTHSHTLSSQDFVSLGHKTDGYSGADIDVMVKEALMIPVRKIQKATHFKKVSGPSPTDPKVHCNDLWTPCAPRDANAQEISWMLLPADKITVNELPLSIFDFMDAFDMTQKSVNAEDLRKYEDYSRSI